ncbi:methyl-accepting chemotaxis protein [Lysobacter pythonis]|uniref:Methyl-accepting chemotaxis protein n=1 Tax=Solilutibacter pythonis TaxID=2483112 RepID=A0A3M2I047_9GAMM|nr:methyl-accepting chemotaxis protein [Lysobacter pythonis]RMH93513.1 methyl-accepting chemotaxis protein [Lysobacter pythonis]
MSAVNNSVVGRSREASTNVWLTILIIAILVFAANTVTSVWRATSLGGANTAVADLQVLSQQLASRALEATGGDAEAFKSFKATREQIDRNISLVDSRYGQDMSVSASIAQIQKTWQPLARKAQQIVASEAVVTGLGGDAGRFNDAVPRLQAQLDETVRAMSSAGAPSSQQYLVMRQSILVSSMARNIAEIRAGGSAATLAGQRLQQDELMFEQVMTGLREGGENAQGARRVAAAAAGPLNQANQIWQGMKKDLDAIQDGSPKLLQAQAASAEIAGKADTMLQDSRNLFSAFTAAGSLKDTNLIGNIWISIASGLVALAAIAGFVSTQYRVQRVRRTSAEELTNRNQEAIMRLLDEMGSLAEGDLTVKATVTEDMTGAIADSINFAVEQLRSLVGTINNTSVRVASSAQETQATAMHLAEAAEHQATEIGSATDRINEIAGSINQVSENSAQSAEVAQRSVEIAANGAGVVRQTIQGMDSIRGQIQETSKRIKRLGESSQEIGAIVELINDISEQTNILALNASIQAASAGEAGRGFAVVADEVQRLAERASNATKRIEGLVSTIQSDTIEAVSSMEQTTTEVVRGARLAEDAGTALGEIERVSSDLASLIRNISQAASQQSNAASNITDAMNTIQSITVQTSQGAHHTAESIGNLAQLASDLRRSVADFKLPA